MNEVIREFLIETHENLAQLDLDLVALEKDPTERETLGRVFRTLHTVKGTAGFLGLQKLQAVAHAAENLLSRLREGELSFNAEIASAGPQGLTADEIASRLTQSVLSIRPRVSELKEMGEIEKNGLRRPNVSGMKAAAWRIKER